MVKKKKNKQRKVQQRHEKKKRQKAATVKRKHRDQGGIVYFPEGKLSEAIQDYAYPLLETADGQEEYATAIKTAIRLWNIALLPSDQARIEIENLLDEAPYVIDAEVQERAHVQEIFTMMYEHKLKNFPDDLRAVDGYSLTENEQGFYLETASYIN